MTILHDHPIPEWDFQRDQEDGRPGFAVRLAGFALSRLRRLSPFGRSSLARWLP